MTRNGNCTNAGCTLGDDNRMLSDGVHSFNYDPEGSRTRSTEIATGNYVEYSWTIATA